MKIFLASFVVLAGLFATAAVMSQFHVEVNVGRKNAGPILLRAKKMLEDGLARDALDLLRPWTLDAKNTSDDLPDAISLVCICFQQLNQVSEVDDYLEKVLEIHKDNWKARQQIAQIYQNGPAGWIRGVVIDGKFERGPHRGAGEWATCANRDRVRSLQILSETLPLIDKLDDKTAAGLFYITFADSIMNLHLGNFAWQLQSLTDLSALPDYEVGFASQTPSINAPVDSDGNPVFYYIPESWETAKNDGERWRWALQQCDELAPTLLAETLNRRALFNQMQFGEQTLQSFQNYQFFQNRNEDSVARTTDILSLETLADSETIANLATGIKRFTLPDEFNYIKLYQKIAELKNKHRAVGALLSLAEIAQNRLQFPKAAEYLQKIIDKYPKQSYSAKEQLAQIVQNWGRFNPTGSKVAGTDATLQYTFRNGKQVTFTANEIKMNTLLDDIKAYLKSKPTQLDWSKTRIDQIGYQLVFGPNGDGNSVSGFRKKYLGKEVAKWSLDLEPAAKHFDRTTEVDVPIKKAGAYLVKAEMEGGNTEYIVLWLSDTAIVQKQLDNEIMYYLCDAKTGTPLPESDLDFFGYAQEWKQIQEANNRQRQEIIWHFDDFATKTNDFGIAFLSDKRKDSNTNFGYNWLVTTGAEKGDRFAYLGFNSIWFGSRYDADYNETKAFIITDRPVYKPKDTVEIKCWIGTAKYDKPNENEWAGKSILYDIYNPRGEKIVDGATAELDGFGGFVTKLELPDEAPLGVYQFSTRNFGGGNFRVEEYQKPEYEVTIEAPKEPIKLGDKISATIKAKYYFGSPVTEATVKYKVLREKATTEWFPFMRWDWFYGRGYWWFSYNSDWLPGWNNWGICRPAPMWSNSYGGPPEVVVEREVKIGPDGTIPVEIDTEIAKILFPNADQQYTISAEVMDNSRRTITGTGTVLVAKEPFKIYSWVDSGYYAPNQQIKAAFQTRRLDGKPVSGKGIAKLTKIDYIRNEKENKVEAKETEVISTDLVFNDEGRAEWSLNAAAPGQYKISSSLDKQEGGYVFTIYDEKNQPISNSYKFTALELIPEKTEYDPGENVSLRINTDRENATVLFFAKPTNGIALKPQMIRLDGKSHEISIPVEVRDMPNFFLEAITIYDGQIFDEVKEIVVPPQKRIVNVDVKPSASSYKPGEKAKAELVVTDLDGKPVIGQTVVSIYDKSVEYISGGSNVPDIKEFFWKWRRHHNPSVQWSFDQYSPNMQDPGKPGMQQLGTFGNMAEQLLEYDSTTSGISLGMNLSLRERGRRTALAKDSGSFYNRGGFGGGAFAAAPAAAARNLSKRENEPMQSDMLMMDAVAACEPMEISDKRSERQNAGGEFELVEPTIRQNFADTALWVGALETNEKGECKIELDMPESLTTWKINVWAMGHGTQVGSGSAEVITRKDLMIRMQTPRFLVEKDESLFSVNIHNYLSTEKEVTAVLEMNAASSQNVIDDSNTTNMTNTMEIAKPGKYELIGGEKTQKVTISAAGESRIDWLVRATQAGEATVCMKGLTDEESDAAQKTIPIFVHGMLKQEAWSSYISPEGESTTMNVNVPAERQPEQTKLTVRFSPTLAASMIEALPYLVDYPFGCTEQTLNRFLPTVIVQKVLIDMNIDLAKLAQEHANLNAQELGQNRRPAIARKIDPVYDIKQVREMVEDGVKKLSQMQCDDGGWGWFGGFGSRSSAHLTALIVHGLRLAVENDMPVEQGIIERGENWLAQYQSRQVELLKIGKLSETERKGKDYKTTADNVDAFVYMVLTENEKFSTYNETMPAMKNFLWRDRGKLSLYGVSMFGIAMCLENDDEKAKASVAILSQYVVQDDENQTAYLNIGGFGNWMWWNWFGSEYETQAYFLKLLMHYEPKNPVAPRLVKYLLNNRRHATYWNSTRDTAICIEAFAQFLRTTGEDKPNMTVNVIYDGDVKKTVEITPENLFQIDNTFVLEGESVTSGPHKIELRKLGTGPLYSNAYLQNFTLEDPITKTGLEVKIERRIYKLIRDESATVNVAGGRGQVVEQKVEKYKRILIASSLDIPVTETQSEIKSDTKLEPGDLVEIELIVESKNDYESILIEDMKAAGLEPVDVQSGYNGNALGAYVEFREERVAFFVYQLARGKHSVSYRLRAVQPGFYSALPAVIWGMYAPELKGNSDENKVRVTDSSEPKKYP
ncbi:MAG: alpha-2-macroglobulin family protein [Thermoguttaceae bacterium]